MTRILVITIVPATLFVCFVSCNSSRHTNLIVGVDFSTSRDSTSLFWYKSIISNVLKNMGPKAELSLLPIDQHSQTASTELFRVNFSRNDYSSEYGGLQKDELERKAHGDSMNTSQQKFAAFFDSFVTSRKPFGKGSDFFGFLRQAPIYGKDGARNIIILLADMLQYTTVREMNFEDSLNTTSDIDRFLNASPTVDLSNVEIVVLTGKQTVTSAKFEVVQEFWEQYFLKCNATLILYSSGATSKLEDILTTK